MGATEYSLETIDCKPGHMIVHVLWRQVVYGQDLQGQHKQVCQLHFPEQTNSYIIIVSKLQTGN